MERNEKTNIQIRRILILGSSSHTKLVKSYEWDRIPSNLNVADYDSVILNFIPFKKKAFSENINIDLIPKFDTFVHLIFSRNSEIIAIGSPDFRLGESPYLPYYWWLPIDLDYSAEHVEKIVLEKEDFSYFFDHIKYSEIVFKKISINRSNLKMIQSINDSISDVKFFCDSIASTRYHKWIGFELIFKILCGGNPRTSGKIIWLPEPTEISSIEAIDLIIRKRYKLQFETEPPEWVLHYQLPEEVPVKASIEKTQIEIDRLNLQLDLDKNSLISITRYKKILYEQGEDVLEPIVRDVLRELGAKVDDPVTLGREDGRLTDPYGRKGILEIKGKKGDLELKDVRQIDQWTRDAIADEQCDIKGILIVNLQREIDPKNRKNFIPPNCKELAERFKINIITTTQLFNALVQHQKGEFVQKPFWDKVSTTDGKFNLP